MNLLTLHQELPKMNRDSLKILTSYTDDEQGIRKKDERGGERGGD